MNVGAGICTGFVNLVEFCTAMVRFCGHPVTRVEAGPICWAVWAWTLSVSEVLCVFFFPLVTFDFSHSLSARNFASLSSASLVLSACSGVSTVGITLTTFSGLGLGFHFSHPIGEEVCLIKD